MRNRAGQPDVLLYGGWRGTQLYTNACWPEYTEWLRSLFLGENDVIGVWRQTDPKPTCAENAQTPLHEAAWYGDAEAIKALLAAKADPNARDELGQTPLHRARSAKAIKLLLDAGTDIGARNEDGLIPFDLIPDDSPLVGTSAYWRLNDARFD